ncbi:MAG: ABC transporter permease subunit [Thermoplasmata archaeon]|nr:ABC transporter permease subunit [Thermoplasmata archaeon]
MKVERRGYLPYKGARMGRLSTLLTYVLFEMRSMLTKKRSIILLVLIMFLLSFPVLSVLAGGGWQFYQMKKMEVSRAILSTYLEFSSILLFLGLVSSAITVSPRVSSEMKEGTLAIILSRPITRDDYFVIKLSSSFAYIFTLIGLPAVLSAILFMGALPPSVKYDSVFILSRLLAVLLIYSFFLTSLGLFSSTLLRSPTAAGVLTFFLPWVADLAGALLNTVLNLPRKYILIALISGTLGTATNGFVSSPKGADLTLWHQALALSVLVPALMVFVAYLIIKGRQEV